MNVKLLIFIFSKLKQSGCSPANNKNYTRKDIWTGTEIHSTMQLLSSSVRLSYIVSVQELSFQKMHEATDKSKSRGMRVSLDFLYTLYICILQQNHKRLTKL